MILWIIIQALLQYKPRFDIYAQELLNNLMELASTESIFDCWSEVMEKFDTLGYSIVNIVWASLCFTDLELHVQSEN